MLSGKAYYHYNDFCKRFFTVFMMPNSSPWQVHVDVIKWKHVRGLLSLCAGNSPVTGKFPLQRPVMRSFVVFCDLCLNKPMSEQS